MRDQVSAIGLADVQANSLADLHCLCSRVVAVVADGDLLEFEIPERGPPAGVLGDVDRLPHVVGVFEVLVVGPPAETDAIVAPG